VGDPVLDLAAAPPSVQRLGEWLNAEGFVVSREQHSGVNNRYAELRDESRRVELTTDRGDWSLAIGIVGMSDTYHPDEWEAWLDGFELAGDLSSLDHQVEFIIERWGEAIAAARMLDDAEAQIRAIGVDYVRRRFGARGEDS
jgi:hypothetical protein